MAAKDVVSKGKAAGLTLTEKYVWQIRSAAKKVAKKAKAPVKTARAAKVAAPAAKGRKPGKLAQFVLAQDPKLSAPEVVKLAKGAGFDVTAHRVHNIRWRAKQKGTVKAAVKAAPVVKTVTAHVYAIRTAAKAKAKKGKAAPAPAKVVRTKAKQSPATRPTGIAGVPALDLAYAVGRLIEAGTTTAAEIVHLAAERTARIQSLEAHLAALKGGNVPEGGVATVAKPGKPGRAGKAPKQTMAKKAKPVAAKKGDKTITRSNGRKFTMTPKALAARKLQGTYLGHLRQVPEAEKPAFKTIAKEEGVAAAVAELKKRLGKA
jgi:hypothetical protein